MAVDFPPSPNVGDTLTGPYGEVYTWDGVRWTLTAPSDDGGFNPPTTGVGDTFVLQDQPTVNQPVIMGVTDGSDALPGAVGEFVLANDGQQGLIPINGISSQNFPGILQTTLSAGDWLLMVQGRFQIGSANWPNNVNQAFTSANNYFGSLAVIGVPGLSIPPVSWGPLMNWGNITPNFATAAPPNDWLLTLTGFAYAFQRLRSNAPINLSIGLALNSFTGWPTEFPATNTNSWSVTTHAWRMR